MHRDRLTDANLRGAPTLAVEVVSDSRRDRTIKRDLYARFGVEEYWVVDPEADRIEVHTLGPRGYGAPRIVEPGSALTSPLLPGLPLDLAGLVRR